MAVYEISGQKFEAINVHSARDSFAKSKGFRDFWHYQTNEDRLLAVKPEDFVLVEETPVKEPETENDDQFSFLSNLEKEVEDTPKRKRRSSR